MFTPPPLPRTLAAAMRDTSSLRAETRASAVADLARLGASTEEVRAQVVPAIERALRDEAPQVRVAAAVALADLRAIAAVPSLLFAIEDADGLVRQMALAALGEIGDCRAVARVGRALSDERPEVRYQAIMAYARLADAESTAAALVRASSDPDPAIVHIALRVAEDRGLGEALFQRSIALAKHETPEVRLAAAILLGKQGHLGGKDVLLAVVARKLRVREHEDEHEAVELVGALGLREAVPHLERRVFGLGRFWRDNSTWHARIALARLGHERAIREITRALTTARGVELTSAVVAAGRARLREVRGQILARASEVEDRELVDEALSLLA